MAAVQFIYSWEMNKPEILTDSLRTFFENQEGEEPREYYEFAEELIDGIIDNIEAIDEIIKERRALESDLKKVTFCSFYSSPRAP